MALIHITEREILDIQRTLPHVPPQDIRLACEIADHAVQEAILSVVTKAEAIQDSRAGILCVALAYEKLVRASGVALLMTRDTVKEHGDAQR